VALAALHHHEERGRFTTGLHPVETVGGRYVNGTCWEVELFPYFEQENLKNRWDYADFRKNVVGEMNATTAVVVKLLVCPSDPLPDPVHFTDLSAQYPQFAYAAGFYGLISYGGNAGTCSYGFNSYGFYQSRDGIFFQDSSIGIKDVTDGSSNTFLFGERSHRDPEFDRFTLLENKPWYPLAGQGQWASLFSTSGWSVPQHLLSTPVSINYMVPSSHVMGDGAIANRLCAFGSSHPGGANFAFADGSVHFVSDSIPLATLQALSTRAGGEVAGDY
jgi:prepilin-type processing-associated H-X9-DG protein